MGKLIIDARIYYAESTQGHTCWIS